MMLLFDNARKFDAYTHPETERQDSADADALQAVMKQTIADTLELLKKLKLVHKEQVSKIEPKTSPVPPATAKKLLQAKPSFKEQLMTVLD
eukprot:SAG31_NODE_42507_length_271_cov_0.848837_1_plen_90_part_11